MLFSNLNRQFRSNCKALIQCLCLLVCLVSIVGCGKTLRQAGTEQLLASDAIDRAVSVIDFSALTGKKVFFDTQFIRNIKSVGFVNADYIISSLRQQMVAAECLIQDNREAADFIIEARVGTLGADQNELSYGLPASNILSTASTLVSSVPTLPAIPEISIAKRIQQSAATKIGIFAYNRETKEPVWQSGIKQASSKSREFWFLGAGPFQRGSIYEGTQLAGTSMWLPFRKKKRNLDQENFHGIPYKNEFVFSPEPELELPTPDNIDAGKTKVELASQTKAIKKEGSKSAPAEKPPVKEIIIPESKGPVYEMTDPTSLTK